MTMTHRNTYADNDLVSGLLLYQDGLSRGDAARAGQAVRQGDRGLLQLLDAAALSLLEANVTCHQQIG